MVLKPYIMYIYKIQNKVNNRLYVGSTKNYNARWNSHKKQLRENTHKNIYLQEDYNKYGLDNFEFSLLYTFNTLQTKQSLLNKEKYFLDKYPDKLLYNIDLRINNTSYKSLSVKNNRFKPKKSLSYVILKSRKFEEKHLKYISVDYKIPLTTVKNTVNNLIKSNKLRYEDGIYYRL